MSVEEINLEERPKETELQKTTEDWEEYVRAEVNSVLDRLLPVSTNGLIGVSYKNLIIEETEAGPAYDDTKVIGVDIVLSFDFGKEIDRPM